MNKLKRLLSIALGAVLSVFGALLFSPIDGADGKYEMSYDFGGQSGIGKQMLEKYFDKTAVVEKINDRYYFSFTQLSSSMENLSLNLESGKQIGYRVTEDNGNRKTYSYTLSEENLQKELPFSVFVSVRGETFPFTITLNLSSARRGRYLCGTPRGVRSRNRYEFGQRIRSDERADFRDSRSGGKPRRGNS